MNFRLPTVIMFAAGIILMYAALKNTDPRDVILMGLGKPSKYPPLMRTNADPGFIRPLPPAGSTPTPGTPSLLPNPQIP